MICACGNYKGARALCNKCYQVEYLKRPGTKKRMRDQTKARANALIGFTPKIEESLKIYQNIKCAICLTSLMESGRGIDSMQRDHDHITGKARGLLCGACNKGIGYYEKYQHAHGLVISAYEEYLNNPPASKINLR